MNEVKKNIAIFASGSGTNAQRIAEYFAANHKAKIALIVCNNSKAFVIERAKKLNIPLLLIDRERFYNTSDVVNELKKYNIDLIVLAGFLWMIPANLIEAFPNKIINVHPALLPKHGGKGMYGMHVHKAVINEKDKESGITIHWVNEHYDEGKIIAQFKCSVSNLDTPETLAQKIHELEQKHFPETINSLL